MVIRLDFLRMLMEHIQVGSEYTEGVVVDGAAYYDDYRCRKCA